MKNLRLIILLVIFLGKGIVSFGQTLSSSQTICSGTSPSPLTTGLVKSLTSSITWEHTTDGINWIFDTDNRADGTWQPPTLTTSTWYKVYYKCGNSCYAYTNTILITVYQPVNSGSIGSDQTICYNSQPSVLGFSSNPTGGNGTFTYQWFQSSDNSIFTVINGSTSSNFQPPILTQKTYYKCLVTSSCNFTAYTNTVTINVYGPLTGGTATTNQNLCQGVTPTLLNGTMPTGGNNSYSYQWQRSTDNNTYTDIVNAVFSSYQPPITSSDVYYRKKIMSGTCGPAYSSSALIHYYPILNVGSVDGTQTICYGNTPASFTMTSSPTGGSGSYSYKWQQLVNNVWQDISGATNSFYQAPALTTTSYYHRLDINTCGSPATNSITVTVDPALVAGAIGDAQTINYNKVPNALSPTLVESGGTGTYNYSWQSSPDNTSWTTIGGTNTATYQPSALTKSTYFRKMVISGGNCGSVYTNAVLITVLDSINPGVIGNSQTICNGYSAYLSGTAPSGANGTFTFQWQSSIDGIIFTNIPGEIASSYDASSLNQTTYFRRGVFSGSFAVKYSNIVAITVSPAIVAAVIGNDQTVCYNTIPGVISLKTPPSGGNGTWYYYWQKSTDNVNWTLTGVSAANFQYSSTVTSKVYFKLNVANSCGGSTSNVVTVTPLSVLLAGSVGPMNQKICSGSAPAQLTVGGTMGGSGNYAYQWQQSSDNITFNDIAGASSYNYQPGTLSQSMYYRVKATSGTCDPAFSEAIKVIVYNSFVAPLIGTNETQCYNQAQNKITIITPTLGSDSVYSYQWRSSTDGNSYSDIPSQISTSYQPITLTTTTYYKLAVTSPSCGTVYSNAVSKIVLPALSGNTVTSAQTVCYNTAPVLFTGSTPTGGDGTFLFQWYYSTDGVSYKIISGATSANYQASALTASTWYERLVSSAGCAQSVSTPIKVTVLSIVNAGTITADQAITYNTTPAILSGTNASGGTGSYTYQWQMSYDDVIYSDISSATASTYQSGKLTKTTYFRRMAISGSCSGTPSNKITVVVYSSLYAGTIGTTTSTVCYGTAPADLITILTPTGGSGVYWNQWYSSTDKTSWNEVPSATDVSMSPPVLYQTTYYKKRVVASISNDTAFTAFITVVVKDDLNSGIISQNQAICYNASFDQLNGTMPTGGSGTYTYMWQYSYNNSAWNDMGITTTFLPSISLQGSTYYRRNVTSKLSSTVSCGTKSSASIKVTVYPPLYVGEITTPNESICQSTAPSQLISTSASGGSGYYSYLWKVSTDTGKTWFNTTDTIVTYQPGTLQKSQQYLYQIVSYSSNCIPQESIADTVTVLPGVTSGKIIGEQTVCYKGIATQLTESISATGGDNTYTYQWQKSFDASSWNNILGEINAYFQPQSSDLTQTIYYRRLVTSNNCSTSASNFIKITVLPQVSAGTLGGSQAICYKNVPGAVYTLINPTGGNGFYSYQWQKSTLTNQYSDISGATSTMYQPTDSLITNTSYRLKIINSCSTVFANPVTVTVHNFFFAGTVDNAQTIIANSAPSLLSGSVPLGGNGIFNYQWQMSSDSINFISIAGGNSANFQPSKLSQTTFFRRIDQDSCNSKFTNVVKIAVLPKVGNNTITSPSAKICYNGIPTAITGTMPNGGDGNYIYRWQKSTDGTIWSNTLSGSATSFSSTNLTVATYFRRMVIDPGYDTSYSNVSFIDLYPSLSAALIGSDQKLCYGNSANSLTILNPTTGGTGMYSYQWQKGINSTSFSDIAGANNQNYTPTFTTGKAYFKLKTIDLCGAVVSNYVTVEITQKFVAGSVTGTQTIPYGGTPSQLSGGSAYYGNGNYSYLWLQSPDKISWTPGVGAVNNTQNFQPYQLTTTTYFRRFDTDDCGNDSSNIITVTVLNDLNAGIITDNQTICSASAPAQLTGTMPNGGDGNFKYLWQYSTDGQLWNNLSISGTTASYQPGALVSTTYYRRKVYCPAIDTAFSNVITISINPVLSVPTIGDNQTICNNTVPVPLYVVSGLSAGSSFQWQRSTDNVIFKDITNEINNYLSLPALTSKTYFKLKVTDMCTTVNSNSVLVNVDAPLIGGLIESNQIIATSKTPAQTIGATPTGGDGNYTFQWLKSTDGNGYSNILVSGNTQNYAPSALTSDLYLKRITYNNCTNDTSNSVKITVLPVLTSGLISTDQTICYGLRPDSLIGATPTGGIGTYNYSWQSSLDENRWNNIHNTNSANYKPSSIKAITYFRRSVISQYCDSVFTNDVKIIPRDSVGAPSITYQKLNCKYSSVKISISNEDKSLSYNWYDSTNNYITSGINYTFTSLKQNSKIYVSSINSINCPSSYTLANVRVDSVKADFTPDIASVKIGTPIHFVNNSINGSSYVWEFFDGDGSHEISPYHYYNSKGLFNVRLVAISPLSCKDTLVKLNLITVKGLTGVEENKSEVLNVYPNPFFDFVYLTSETEETYQVEILDVLGKIVYSNQTKGDLEILGLESLKPGVYFLRYLSSSKNENFKLIKK